MKRLLTAAIGVPLALLALFGLPAPWFFVLLVALFGWVAIEFVGLMRPVVPGAPLGLLVPLVAVVALLLSPELVPGGMRWDAAPALVALAALLAVGGGAGVLLLRAPVGVAMPAIGVLAFGAPYFALPIASLYRLQQIDPWIVFLLMGIVWLGDTAAYYAGRAFGRHKLAPVVSPNKSWEGAAASLLTSGAMTLVWSWLRLGRVDASVVALCLVVAMAAQLGDLVESMIKRGIGVKDSGHTLPGHGGFWDRMDAMLFAAPVMDLGVMALGVKAFVP